MYKVKILTLQHLFQVGVPSCTDLAGHSLLEWRGPRVSAAVSQPRSSCEISEQLLPQEPRHAFLGLRIPQEQFLNLRQAARSPSNRSPHACYVNKIKSFVFLPCQNTPRTDTHIITVCECCVNEFS